MNDQQRAVVRGGYDEVAASYLADRTLDGADVDVLTGLIDRLTPGALVLDGGCGAGVPVARTLLAAGLRVVGLDFSIAQLALAQQHVPDARPVQGDLARFPFPDASFDGVVSYYAIIHVTRTEHPAVFAEVHRVLKPGGYALLCLGAADLPEDHDPESWLGAPMYWSHFDGATNLELMRDAGLEIVNDQEIPDPMGHRGHLFVLARRPTDS
jgi:ubiquinone/menaquinone biosynthesis C-methylase UbiE